MIDEQDQIIAGKMFEDVAKLVASDFAREDVADEEDFSGQFIGRIKGHIDNLVTDKTKWRVGGAILKDDPVPHFPSVGISARQTKKHTEENPTGADMLIVLDIHADDYVVKKGVLVQAKRLTRGHTMQTTIVGQLRGQCNNMLNITPASFVFLYAPTDVEVLSATVVANSKRNDLHALSQFRNSPMVFFTDFFKCWIGDPRLKATDQQSLADMMTLTEARNALLLTVESSLR